MASLPFRIFDVDLEDGLIRNPLGGLFDNLAVPTLAEALLPLCGALPKLHPTTGQLVLMASEHAEDLHEAFPHMTRDECTAIVLYTMEDQPRERSPYFAMNGSLREQQLT